MGELSAIVDPAGTELPPFVTCGDHVLDRVAGDGPDELVYTTLAGPFSLWLKSPNLLAGPWDWIVMGTERPVDFQGPFATRDEATDSLSGFLARSGLLGEAAPGPGLVEVSADHVGAGELEGAPGVTARAAVTLRGNASTPDDIDSEVLRLALDLAIATLRGARARIAPNPRQG